MQSNLMAKQEQPHLLPPKKDEALRRVVSDIPKESDKIIEDFRHLTMTINEEINAECECCGMSEECTPTYIRRIKEFHCGKWVCGLCSEAVKEQLKRAAPTIITTIEEALESHMTLCKKFNRTTRLNPKLSLAGTMRDIARKSSQKRTSDKDLQFASNIIARTSSCGPRIDLKIKQSPIQ